MSALLTSFAKPLQLRSREGHEPGRKVTWLELFFDLIFVAAVSQVGAPLADDYSFAAFARLGLLFVLIWWAWHGHTTYATRFDSDDVIQRGLTLLQMFAATVMAINARDALDSRDAAGFAAAYAAMRLLLVGQYVRARHIPESRALTTAYAIGFGAAAALWLTSAVVPTPMRFWLWAAALVVDFGTPLVTGRHLARVPPDSEHLPERFGLFTIILIGEAMVGVMRGMESQPAWTREAAITAFLSMTSVFAIWWGYFDGSGATGERPLRSRADIRRFHVWTYAHLPLYLGVLVFGVGLHHVITVAGVSHLHGEEIALLVSALAAAAASLVAISRASAGAAVHRIRRNVNVPNGATPPPDATG